MANAVPTAAAPGGAHPFARRRERRWQESHFHRTGRSESGFPCTDVTGGCRIRRRRGREVAGADRVGRKVSDVVRDAIEQYPDQ